MRKKKNRVTRVVMAFWLSFSMILPNLSCLPAYTGEQSGVYDAAATDSTSAVNAADRMAADAGTGSAVSAGAEAIAAPSGDTGRGGTRENTDVAEIMDSAAKTETPAESSSDATGHSESAGKTADCFDVDISISSENAVENDAHDQEVAVVVEGQGTSTEAQGETGTSPEAVPAETQGQGQAAGSGEDSQTQEAAEAEAKAVATAEGPGAASLSNIALTGVSAKGVIVAPAKAPEKKKTELKKDCIYIRSYQDGDYKRLSASIPFRKDDIAAHEASLPVEDGYEAKILLPLMIRDNDAESVETMYTIELGTVYAEELSGAKLYHYDEETGEYTELDLTYYEAEEGEEETSSKGSAYETAPSALSLGILGAQAGTAETATEETAAEESTAVAAPEEGSAAGEIPAPVDDGAGMTDESESSEAETETQAETGAETAQQEENAPSGTDASVESAGSVVEEGLSQAGEDASAAAVETQAAQAYEETNDTGSADDGPAEAGLGTENLGAGKQTQATAADATEKAAAKETSLGSILGDVWEIIVRFFTGKPSISSLKDEELFPTGRVVFETQALGEFFFVYEAGEERPAFRQEADLGDAIVSVSADEGVFPAGSVLEVTKMDGTAPELEPTVAEARTEKTKVAKSFTFDIKVFDKDGNEVQPTDGSKVHISFKMPEAANTNLEPSVYHIKEETETVRAEKLESETTDDVVTAVSDGFSYYTVEFVYESREYILEGGNEIRLSDLLASLGLSGEAQSWAVSNDKLFNIYRGDETGVIYEYEPINEEESLIVPSNSGTVPWLLSLEPFNTQEWLKVVIDDVEYEITVTDDNTSQTVPSSGFYDNTNTVSNYHADSYNGVPGNSNVSTTADTYVNEAGQPSIVKQPTSGTGTVYDFAAGMSLSTIYIDETKFGDTKGTFAYETRDQNLLRAIKYNADKSVTYDPWLIGGHLQNGTVNELNGPLFSFTFDDAAILPDGTKAKVKITYSNAKIFTDERLFAMENAGTTDDEKANAYYVGAVTLAAGSVVRHKGGDNRNLMGNRPDPAFTRAQTDAARKAYVDRINKYKNQPGLSEIDNTTFMNTPSLGKSIDVTYQVIDDDGNPVNGTFLYAIVGINLERDPYAISSNNAGRGLWWVHEDYPEMHFFNEQIAVTNNTIASDYIYVRANNGASDGIGTANKNRYFYPQVIEENGKTKIISNAYKGDQSSDGLYSSGFVTLANAFSGFTVTAYGHSYGSGGTMNTQAYGARRIWYRYTSQTGPNGDIQTTTEGNYGGTLNDAGDSGKPGTILDPGTYVVTEGKTVTYTMTPDPKYRISKLYVKNRNGILQEVKYNNGPLHDMEEGDTAIFKDAADNDVILTAKADGVFTLEMPYAQADEEVRVTWEPTMGELVVNKQTVAGDGMFDYMITASRKEPVTKYNPHSVGSVWYIRNLVTDTYEYGNAFREGFSLTIPMEDLADALADVTLTERVVSTAGHNIWKTNKTFADLGIKVGENDGKPVYVNFTAALNAVPGDPLSDFIGNASGTDIEERLDLYLVDEEVINKTFYWNFATNEEKEEDPGEYPFSITTQGKAGNKSFEIPINFTYTVREDTKAKWDLISINGDESKAGGRAATDTLTEQDPLKSETFLNRPLYDLNVTKETVGGPAENFTFRARIWKGGLAPSYLDLSQNSGFTKIEETTGEYEFTVVGGGTVTIPNIPYGYEYAVRELTPAGWRLLSVDGNTAITQAEGTMTQDKTETFMNEAIVYTLTVSKTVTGNMGSRAKDFRYTATIPYFTGKTVQATKTLYGGGTETVNLAFNDKGKASFTITHGESIDIPGIFYNTTYELTENNAVPYTVSSTVTYTKPGENAGDPPVLQTDSYTVASVPVYHMLSNHRVEYTNDLDIPIPTGVTPWNILLAVLAVFTGLAFFAGSALAGRVKRHGEKAGASRRRRSGA